MTLENIHELVCNGKTRLIPGAVNEALDDGIAATDILNTMIEAMSVVGERFSRNEIFVPEMLVAAKAMKKGVDVLKPHLSDGGVGSMGKMIMGTVAGDLHDIGKNLVIMMIESAGFEVIDLGVDVPVERFISAYEENPDTKIIGCSALLTTTMPVMEEVVKAAEAAGIRDQVKIMIGGAPVTEEFRAQIGADVYTDDAASAADAAVKLCQN